MGSRAPCGCSLGGVRRHRPWELALDWSLPLHRVHELEEMVKDQETTAEQALEEEARRHREAYGKLERERSTEIELLHTRWAFPQSRLPPGTACGAAVPILETGSSQRGGLVS